MTPQPIQLPLHCLHYSQVGLIVFLAHVGSFVPASHCVMGLTDRILVRIVSQEQLALQQSTFMADLTQVG